MTYRQCTGCGETKPQSEYYEKAKRDAKCKVCIRLRVRRYQEANPEKVRETNRISVKKYATINRQKVNERCAKYRENYPERRKKACRDSYYRYLDRNRLKSRMQAHARRTALKDGTLTVDEWLGIAELSGFRCVYCLKLTKLEIDHFVPVDLGGLHDALNVVPACRSCNASKLNRTILAWTKKVQNTKRLAGRTQKEFFSDLWKMGFVHLKPADDDEALDAVIPTPSSDLL